MKKQETFKDFGEWLQDLREEKGWTEAEVIEKLDIPALTEKDLKKWEKDTEIPDLKIIYKIAEIYNVDPTDLLVSREQTLKIGISGIPKTIIKWMGRVFGVSAYVTIFLGYLFLFGALIITVIWFVNIVGTM